MTLLPSNPRFSSVGTHKAPQCSKDPMGMCQQKNAIMINDLYLETLHLHLLLRMAAEVYPIEGICGKRAKV